MGYGYPNKARIMPGGWHFKDPNINVEIPYADSLENLVERLENYYLENRITGRNAAVDVNDYICKTFPTYCHWVQDPVHVETKGSRGNRLRLMDKVERWVHKLWSLAPLAYVDGGEAHSRVAVCMNCPFNRKWDVCSTCTSKITNIRKYLHILLNGRNTPIQAMGCDSCGHSNQLAVWLDTKYLTRGANAPAYCWVR